MKFIMIIGIIALMGVIAFLLVKIIYPEGGRRTMDIHLDENTKLNISHGESGNIRLDFINVAYEDRQPDEVLMPEIGNSAGPTTPFTRDFWKKVAGIDDLEPEERSRLCETLHRYGVIDRKQVGEILLGREDPAADVRDDPRGPAAVFCKEDEPFEPEEIDDDGFNAPFNF